MSKIHLTSLDTTWSKNLEVLPFLLCHLSDGFPVPGYSFEIHIFHRMFSCTWRKAGILYQFLSNEHNSIVIKKHDNLRSRSKMFYRLWNCIFMLGFHSPQNQCHPSGWNRSQKQKVCGGLAHQIRTVGDAEKGTDACLSYSKIWSAALWELMCLMEMMLVWRMGGS